MAYGEVARIASGCAYWPRPVLIAVSLLLTAAACGDASDNNVFGDGDPTAGLGAAEGPRTQSGSEQGETPTPTPAPAASTHDWTTQLDRRWILITSASSTQDGTDTVPRHLTVVAAVPPLPDPGQGNDAAEPLTRIGGSYHLVAETIGPIERHEEMCAYINEYFDQVPLASAFLIAGNVLIECKTWPEWSH